jgi:transposase
MFKKTKVRSILEFLEKNQSGREVSKVLKVSRNTAAEVYALYKSSGKTWDEISDYDDDRLYELFYPDKFKYKPRYAPVDYSYIHKELKKTGVTEKILWEEYSAKCKEEGVTACSYVTFTKNYTKFTAAKNYTSHVIHKPGLVIEVDWSGPTMSYVDPDTKRVITAYLFVATMPYSQKIYVEATTSINESAWLSCHVNMFHFFEGTPVKIVCDNLKTGVITHPKKGEIIFNEAYLALGEYYSVAIMPTGIKKPKQKASVEGSVGRIATAIIAKLRNEIYPSLGGLNAAIQRVLKELNDKPFQKRSGSRSLVFEVEEKPYLRALPLIPYEVCKWSYGHKANSNSHIWCNKGQYSVPSRYIGRKVDVKYNNHFVFIYYDRTEISRHQILPKGMSNGIRTDETHLPFPLQKNISIEDICNKARQVGPKAFEVIHRMFDEAKVKEQPLHSARSILSIADNYSAETLEKACEKALKQYHLPYYKTIITHAKNIQISKEEKVVNKSTGIVRGSDYYKKGDMNK